MNPNLTIHYSEIRLDRKVDYNLASLGGSVYIYTCILCIFQLPGQDITPRENLRVFVIREISGLQLRSGYKTIILAPIIRQSETGLQMTSTPICIDDYDV